MAYEPTVSITMGRKVNLGSYESADVHVSLNQIPMSATEDDIKAMIEGPAQVAFKAIAAELKARCDEIRAKGAA